MTAPGASFSERRGNGARQTAVATWVLALVLAAFVLPPRLDGPEMQLPIHCSSGDDLVRFVQRREDGRLGLSTTTELSDPLAYGYQAISAPVEYLPPAPKKKP